MQNKNITFLENFTLASVAGIIAKTAIFPLERLRLTLHLKDQWNNTPSKGLIDYAHRALRNYGVLFFFRGNLQNCIRYFPGQGFNFAFKEKIKEFSQFSKSDNEMMKLLKNIGCGGAAGVISLLLVYPHDFARNRFEMSRRSDSQFKSLRDVYIKTINTNGIAGFYKQFGINCAIITVYRGAYFGFYDTLRPRILGDNAGLGTSFVLAWIVTLSASFCSYPIDTIRRRMMMKNYKSSWDCMQSISTNEGPRAFMKGATSNIFQCFTELLYLLVLTSFKVDTFK